MMNYNPEARHPKKREFHEWRIFPPFSPFYSASIEVFREFPRKWNSKRIQGIFGSVRNVQFNRKCFVTLPDIVSGSVLLWEFFEKPNSGKVSSPVRVKCVETQLQYWYGKRRECSRNDKNRGHRLNCFLHKELLLKWSGVEIWSYACKVGDLQRECTKDAPFCQIYRCDAGAR